ncbi:MAG TPA: peptidase U62 [Acidobacteria bacterium]|nr:peptidase U62 [Acidobacteriota bacterium]
MAKFILISRRAKEKNKMVTRNNPNRTEPTGRPLSTTDLKKILSLALSRGGDFADIFLEYRTSLSILMEEDIIKESSESITLGLGIRVISKDRTGYAYTNDLSEEKLKSAALAAAAVANSPARVSLPARFRPRRISGQVARARLIANSRPLREKMDLVERAYRSALNYDQAIKKVQVAYGEFLQKVWIVNSEGLSAGDSRPMVKLVAMALAEKNGRRESGFAGGGGRVGLEYFARGLTPETIGQEAAREACLLLEAVDPPAGEMPVVLGPGVTGILLHEAIGHGMEADFNRKNVSTFSTMIGKKVAEPFVNIIDDGTNERLPGSLNVDDEGTPGQKTYLVENGILTSYMHDKISAKYYRVKPTGNGRRQSYEHYVQPRMRNTYMLAGPSTPDEVVGSVQKGIYIKDVSNGQVKIGEGDFAFYVSQGNMIENGKLTAPIKDVNIMGNGPKMLANITMLANDLQMNRGGGGQCGKGGQGVPVGFGQPTCLVHSMTVGGVNA